MPAANPCNVGNKIKDKKDNFKSAIYCIGLPGMGRRPRIVRIQLLLNIWLHWLGAVSMLGSRQVPTSYRRGCLGKYTGSMFTKEVTCKLQHETRMPKKDFQNNLFKLQDRVTNLETELLFRIPSDLEARVLRRLDRIRIQFRIYTDNFVGINGRNTVPHGPDT